MSPVSPARYDKHHNGDLRKEGRTIKHPLEVGRNPQSVSLLDSLVKYQVVLMSEEHDIITVQSGRGMQMLNV